MQVKISIVVPSFNYGKYIDDCLNSIFIQSYTNYEVLICDGGSTDESLEVINKYVSSDPRFLLVSESDAGQADAIRKGFLNATGDIYCFLNSDDLYLDDAVFYNVVKNFRKFPDVSLLSFEGFYIAGDGKILKKINYRYHPLDGLYWMKYRTAVLQPGTFWRKSVYLNGQWRTDYHYVFDVIFFYFAYKSFGWNCINIPVAGYRTHGENKSAGVKSERILELADFEGMKFGKDSFRRRYLTFIAKAVKSMENNKVPQKLVLRGIYLFVNSISFISFYRLPGI